MLPRTRCRTCPPLGGPLFLLPQEYTNLWNRWLEIWAVGRGLGDTRDAAISINSNTPVGQGPADTLGQKPQSLSSSAHPWWGGGRGGTAPPAGLLSPRVLALSAPLAWTPFPAGFLCLWTQRSPPPWGFPCPSSVNERLPSAPASPTHLP